MVGEHTITLTHLNIRQSIAILLAKLVLIDIIFACIVLFIYVLFIQGYSIMQEISIQPEVFIVTFGFLGIMKIVFDIYIILKWLHEYYEITPENVIHKKGIIFRKTEQYGLDKVRMMDIQDSFIGELFNFATITLYDIRLNKYLDMYLIHNPDRYANILKKLRPHIEVKKDRVWLPFLKREERDIEDENLY